MSQYSCCSERRGAAGCQVAKVSMASLPLLSETVLSLQLHVTVGARPTENTGYVHTHPPPHSNQTSSTATVYALDCEMCYTTAGLELTRVSMVDFSLKLVYESLVLPPHPIVDYNTRYTSLCGHMGCSVVCVLQVQWFDC